MQIRRWNENKPNTELAAELAEACEIHPFLSLMLVARGIDTPEQVFGFLVGQTMRNLGGKAAPKLVNEILKDKLSEE